MRLQPFAIFAIVVAMMLPVGCFTGIESTPKITEKDVRKQNVVVSAENEFASRLFPRLFSQWREGDRLLVTDSRLSLLLETEPSVSPGDTIVYRGVAEDVSITGDSVTIIEFGSADDATIPLRYIVEMPLSRLNSADNRVEVPFTIDLQLVAYADSMLRGNRYYLMTNLRVDADAQPIAMGKRYVPVTIRGVYPGNSTYPLRVEFEEADGTIASVVMTTGNARSDTRNFDVLFAFNDPRMRYPDISDAVWANIVATRVAQGMTTDECRLSLGSPRDVKKTHNGSSYFERWSFDNGAYLIFEDGRLATFRL